MEMPPRWDRVPRHDAARPESPAPAEPPNRWVIRTGTAPDVCGEDEAPAATRSADAAFAQTMTAVSARFANITGREVGAAIRSSLRECLAALDIDRVTWVGLGETDDTFRLLSHCARPGLPLRPTGLECATLPGLADAARRGDVLSFAGLSTVANATDRQCLRQLAAMSGAAVPLPAPGGGIGMLCFTEHRVERDWTPEDVARMRLVAAVLGSALAIARCEVTQSQAETEAQRLRVHFDDHAVRVPSTVFDTRPHGRLASDSGSMRDVLEQLRQVAPTPATVLLTGETGTGKEVLAQAIHDQSLRRGRPMVRVNCGAIPAALVESELFGRERGAYTGALSSQAGRFEQADGSTIFLDEVGELPLEAQVKLLRVLQEREVERLGGGRSIKVDVRVIAATNKDLERAVAEHAFREDLFYRLNVFPIAVPPLRERVADIPTLIWMFIDEYSRAFGKPVTSIARDSLTALEQYAWPGNVRELRNIIERAVITATGPHLTVDLPRPAAVPGPRSRRLDDVECEHIRAVLDATEWRVRGARGAAALLGLKPTTLESLMARLGLKRR